ncbi:histone-like nucleoid-structuring protein Lsr2, partial [Pseudonocardia alni]
RGRARPLTADPPKGSRDAAGMHTPSYVPPAAGNGARIYYSGRANAKLYGPGSSYAIGVLEHTDGQWQRRGKPVLEGSAPRWSVLEPRVIHSRGRYRMWYQANPHEIGPGEHPDYELQCVESEDGLTGWTPPRVFAGLDEGFFDIAIAPRGDRWVMLLARGSDLHNTGGFPSPALCERTVMSDPVIVAGTALSRQLQSELQSARDARRSEWVERENEALTALRVLATYLAYHPGSATARAITTTLARSIANPGEDMSPGEHPLPSSPSINTAEGDTVARIETVQLIDDLDGATADETVAFTLDGKQFEIDLNAANAATLRDKLAPFVSAARTAGGNRRAQRRDAATAAGSTEARRHNQAVRVWARENGYSVSARGRIPAEVVEAYRDHDSNTSPSAPEKAAPTKRPQPAQFSG